MSKKSESPKSKVAVEDLLAQINELTSALQRERADALNLRRRYDEQIASVRNLVKANVVRELLPIIDNVDRALAHIPKAHSSQLTAHSSQLKTWEDWASGVSGVKAQFDKVLSNMGVERVKTVGEVFDPSLHEAVGVENGDIDSLTSEEVVCEELASGYKLGDEIIRHAMVKVRMEDRK